jgi:hypothetical protein
VFHLHFIRASSSISLSRHTRRVCKILLIFNLHGVLSAGLKKPAEFGENRWNRAGPNSKITDFTVYCFKILEKDKSQQKICKKTRSNSKVTSEEIFVKPSRLDW